MNIRELAKHTGVSPATVSIVLNDKPGVSDETRQRVLKAAAQLGYTPQRKNKPNTRSILFIKHRQHGMLVEENQGFIAAVMEAVEQACRSIGCRLNIAISDGDLEHALTGAKDGGHMGVIVLGTELEPAQYPLLSGVGLPLVVVDNNMEGFPASSVGINNRENVTHLVRYCASLGYTDIGYIKSSISIPNFAERLEAFHRTAREFGMGNPTVISLTPTLLGAYEDMRALLDKTLRLPPCMVADNDSIAIGAIKALKESGYRVPLDISVVGFDDIPFSSVSSPTLTTVSVPKALMGKLAVEQLFRLIDDPEYRWVRLQVAGELVIRGSAKPCQ